MHVWVLMNKFNCKEQMHSNDSDTHDTYAQTQRTIILKNCI